MAQASTSDKDKNDSMEDILQSIKKIIEDDAPAEAKGEVLDLTQVVKEDNSTVKLEPLPDPAPVPAAPPGDVVKSIDEMFAAPTPAPAKPAATTGYPLDDGLISEKAAQSSVAALKTIADTAKKDFSIPHIPSAVLRSGQTVEDLILEALRPMLKEWLDEHLPTIVHKIVEREVKRVVAFHHD